MYIRCKNENKARTRQREWNRTRKRKKKHSLNCKTRTLPEITNWKKAYIQRTNKNRIEILINAIMGRKRTRTELSVSGKKREREKLREFVLKKKRKKKKATMKNLNHWVSKWKRMRMRDFVNACEKKARHKPRRKCQDRRVAMANRNRSGKKTLRFADYIFIKTRTWKDPHRAIPKCYVWAANSS